MRMLPSIKILFKAVYLNSANNSVNPQYILVYK